MKTKNKQNNKTVIKYISIFLSVLILLGLIFIFLEKLQVINFIKIADKQPVKIDQIIDNNKPSEEQILSGQDIKKNNQKETANNDLGISVTSINTTGDIIKIRSVISGVTANNGTCIIKLTQSLKTIEKTANTYALPNSSTCQGFDIDRSELSSGRWDFTLSVSINNKSSSIDDTFVLD